MNDFTSGERVWLWAVAILGLIVVNGGFLYGFFFVPGAFAEAMSNPIAVAFMAEATILLVLLTYLLGRWGVRRISAAMFVVLALLGSLAFALPASILWKSRERPTTL